MKIKGKIGYCDNRDLQLRDRHGNILTGGHYVYIRKYYKNTGTCVVSTCTSLEDNYGNIKTQKMKLLRDGKTYPVPKKDSNFPKWTGVNKTVIYVNKSKISRVNKKRIKKRHKLIIGKM